MEEPENKTVVRRYFLGDLSETEQQHVEESFLLDPEYRENLLIAEHELIEDYLDGVLNEQERDRFEIYFLATPQQKQKLQIARSLKRYAMPGSGVPASDPEADPSRDNSLERPSRWLNRRRPLILLAAAAVFLIAIGLGVIKLNDFRQSRERQAQEQSRHLIIDQKLARINSVDGRREKPPVLTVVLLPVSFRGAGPSRKFSPPDNDGPVELQLVIEGEEYSAYRALLQTTEGSETFAIPDLRVTSTPAGKAVPLRIPPDLQKLGSYRLQLFGVTSTDENELVSDYDFQVADNH
jgi:hypothetical protein